MEGARSFLANRGLDGADRLLTAARLGPYASVADVAALPNGGIYASGDQHVSRALAEPRDAALEHWGYSLDFVDGRHGLFKAHRPSRVGGAVPARGLSYADSTRLSRLSTTTGEGLTPIEHVAAGHEVSAWDLEGSFRWVFLGADSVASSIEFAQSRLGGVRAFSCEEVPGLGARRPRPSRLPGR